MGKRLYGVFMSKSKKHPLLIGTAILTITGLISRIIGFFYRIYLSRLFGEEGMGIYQLLSPVLAISFSLSAAAYQTAISKMVAEKTARRKESCFHPMLCGLSISLPLSLLCTGVLYYFAQPIGTYLLLEPRTVSMLRILSVSIPFSAVHSCINGYFYGIKKAGVPAVAQIVEQLVRVGCVYCISIYAFQRGAKPTINVAILGLVIGEFISMLVTIIAIYGTYIQKSKMPNPREASLFRGISSSYRGILHMAIPLTANRIVLNILQSIEAVSIPSMLKLYGYDSSTALSVYGVLTGMAMPLIFFPNAITSSISVLLLPMISESHAIGDKKAVKKVTLRTVKYCLLLGFCCMCCFGLFGKLAGNLLFHSPLAGHFITTLSFICPFIYLDTTLSSILQGLGLPGHIFVMNVICLLIRLAFVFFVVPLVGINGYLWGMLASQITLSLLYLISLYLFMKKN